MRICKSFVTFLLSFALITFVGCGKQVINSESDEIMLYSWEYTSEQDIHSKLVFDNNNAMFTIESNGEHCVIDGLCVFGDNSFVIVDNTLEKEFLFGYKLTGEYLELEYSGSKVKLNKVKED